MLGLNDLNLQKNEFKVWAKENLGEKTGEWYSPYLDKLGILLSKFKLTEESEFHDNFFIYQDYKEFEDIYIKFIGVKSYDEIDGILNGKALRYPDSFANLKHIWKDSYAKYRVGDGVYTTVNPGGIPDLGTLFRAYLKFLYYNENSNLVYPRKDKNISNQNGEIDDTINYWAYSPGNNSEYWEDFYNEGVIGLGWDYLGDLNNYQNREEIEKLIAEKRNDGIKPTNDSKAVWDFYKEIKSGDIIYAKNSSTEIIGKGIVIGEYYYDDEKPNYKHRYKVNWTDKGSWNLTEQMANKVLTNLNPYPDFILYIERIINNEYIDENSKNINEFKVWMSKQVDINGEYLKDNYIDQRILALDDMEKYFNIHIFGETDTEILKNIKETMLDDKKYNRYKSISNNSIDYYIKFIETKPININQVEDYNIDNFLREVFIDKESIYTLQSLLLNKKNLILKGAPGVGKTYISNKLAYLMMGEKDDSRIQMVQFHQSYSYEDFIEGYRPKASGDGFELKQGPFVKFARKASRDPNRDYFFIIDEINRGNMSKIFGELMMLIENDKRGKSINLLYSNEKFFVPENLYIIGMLNTADRSLALLDYALRRRFSFFELSPIFNNKIFKDYIYKIDDENNLSNVLDEINNLNDYIIDCLGAGFQIGHSYFLEESLKKDLNIRLEEILKYEIIPQIYEYWFDDEDTAKEWENRLLGALNGN